MSLFRLGLLASVVVLGGCAAWAPSALAQTGPTHDLIELKDGSTYEGHIVEALNGSFWMELPSGQLLQVPYTDVARVVRAEPLPVALELPNFDGSDSNSHVFRGGIDLGTTVGARMRWQFETPSIHSLDARFDFGLFIASYPMPVFFHGIALNFLGHTQVHPQLSLNFGLAFPSSLYPFAGVGAAIVYDPPSPFELQVGAIGGVGGSYLGFIPDIHAGFVW